MSLLLLLQGYLGTLPTRVMRTKNLFNGSTNYISWQSREQQVLGSHLL